LTGLAADKGAAECELRAQIVGFPRSRSGALDIGSPILPRPMKPTEPPFDYQQQAQRTSFDWRRYRSLTTPQDQKTCGACWAFATAALAENFYSVFYHRAAAISEQDIINCATGGCSGGYLSNGLDYLQKQ